MRRSRVRPDPVSCQSCRSKKLKCNRVQPCSNCVARGITCNFLVPPQQQTETTTSRIANDAEIFRRIERLESIVLHPAPPDSPSIDISEDIHVTRRSAPNPSLDGIIVSQVQLERDQDSHLLENIGTREDSLLPCLSDGLKYRISSTQEVHEPRTHLDSPSVSEYSARGDTVVTFPVYRTATLLFHSYESHVDHMCRIVHIPTIRSLLKTCYVRVSRKESVLPGQAALLLSIFAIAAFFYQPFESSTVATTEQEAARLSMTLSKSALDVLDHSRRNTSGAVEDIQASIIMSLLIQHFDGFSARGRLLSTAAASIARDLRLHRLDAGRESSSEAETSVRILIDLEVKRRVFWYIASTDWLLSAISGPQEGMYFIHPNHINVRLPKDCTDDDIILGEDNESVIGPQPTGLTFFLEKVRLAHVCREMADLLPLESQKLAHLPYEHITALDERLGDFISSLPFFFRLDAESRQKSKALETIYPMIPVWRYCITTAAHSRRCKLHQRFLLRQSWDPRYTYSRRACLESARVVVQVYEDLSGFYSPSTLVARMGMVVHFTHLALVVMVMDLCFNRDEANEMEVKAHVEAALQIFENARHVSPLLGRCLSSLVGVLQKHQVYLTNPSTSKTIPIPDSIHEPAPDAFNVPGDNQMESSQLGQDSHDLGVPADASFDEFWQIAFQSEPNLDSPVWDNLFSALDSQPM